MSGLNTSNRTTVRFNKTETEYLKKLIKKYKYSSKSKLIKNLAFREIKPFLNNKELETLQTLILELNAIGRNLNQFTKVANKYGALRNVDIKLANEVLKDISSLTDELQGVITR